MANRIPEDFIQTVIDKTDIIEIIQQRVQLKKQGQRFAACCPFHDEKSPSFSVHPQKQFFHCFGCGKGGNVVTFIMEYDKLGFREAMEVLAHPLGMALPELEDQRDHENQSKALFELTDQIKQFFCQQLTQAPEAIEYLKDKRNLTGLTAKTFSLGFAPDSWQALANHFPAQQQPQLLQVGAIKQKNNRYYDAFRQRIMFPIRDTRGRVVGFGGRSLKGEPPKYLNSPETVLFHKNHELYGLYEALQHNRKLNQVIVVEGYMDVVALHQHDISYAVATLGTAINETHIKKLLRYASEIIFCFDGDNAGQRASFKAMLSSLPLLRDGICFKVLTLPGKLDPDDYCQQQGAAAFKALISNAPELPIALLNALAKQHKRDTLASKAAFADEAQKVINTMPNGIYKELLFEKLASKMKMTVDQLNTQSRPSDPSHQKASPAPNKISHLSPTLHTAAAILIQNPALYYEHKAKIDPPAQIVQQKNNPIFKHLFNILNQHSRTTTGSLIEACDQAYRPEFLKLATKSLLIPEAGYLAELLGALNRVVEQYESNVTAALIQRSEQSQLTPEEKDLLNRLLQNKLKKRLES